MRKKFDSFIWERIRKYGYVWPIRQFFRYLRFQLYFIFHKLYTTPINAIFIVTYRCNCRCAMCRIREKKTGQEPATGEMMKIIDEIALLAVDAIGFTGGEPLLREDIFELIAYAKNKNIYTHLSTNGSLLNGERAGKIIGSGLDSISISLDSIHPDIHNQVRGNDAAFKGAVEGLRNILRARQTANHRIEVGIVTVISNKNIDNILEIVDFAEDMGVDNLGFMPLYFHDQAHDPGKVDAVIDGLIRMKKKGRIIDNSFSYLKLMKAYLKSGRSPLRCNASFQSVTVDCFKNVLPCFPAAHKTGQVQSTVGATLPDFLRSPEYRQMHRFVRSCRECCANCHAELNLFFTLRGLWETVSMKKTHLRYQ